MREAFLEVLALPVLLALSWGLIFLAVSFGIWIFTDVVSFAAAASMLLALWLKYVWPFVKDWGLLIVAVIFWWGYLVVLDQRRNLEKQRHAWISISLADIILRIDRSHPLDPEISDALKELESSYGVSYSSPSTDASSE